MLCHLEEIDDTVETGSARHFAGDVAQIDRHDRIDDHMAGRQAVVPADANARTLPDPDRRVDLALPDPVPELLQEHHRPAQRPLGLVNTPTSWPLARTCSLIAATSWSRLASAGRLRFVSRAKSSK